MPQLRLRCVVIGEGMPFLVKVAAAEYVGTLKGIIKEERGYKFPVMDLDLYIVDGLVHNEVEAFECKHKPIDITKCSLKDFEGITNKLATAFQLLYYPGLNSSSENRISILVVLSSRMESNSTTISQGQCTGSTCCADERSNAAHVHKKPRLVSTNFTNTVGGTSSPCFNVCPIAFYNNIFTANNQDGWLQFSNSIPSSMKTAKEILVRNSFQTIASNIHALGKNKYFKAVVIGTLGIGKSNFLIYLLWTLLMERKKVIFLYHPDVIYFDGCGGVFMSNQRDMPQSNDSFWKDEDLWCLFDAKAKTEENLSSLPYSRMKIVVSPSAPRDIINDFQKPPQPSTYFIPLWTEAELEQIAPCFPAADNWKNRFLLLGGIPRIVLEDTTLEASKLLDIASICCDFSDCLKVVIWDSTLTRSSNVMHTLVHITSNEPFMTAEVCFASQAALDNIVHRNMIYAKRNMEQLLSSCKNHSLRAALCGRAFEIYAMEMLEKGGSFQSRQLVRGSCNSKPKETNLIIPSSTRTFADTMSSAHLPNRLYAPKTKSLCTIDAWIPQLGGFQMTINSNEAMRGDHEMYDSCGGKLFWLLPPTIYGSFSKEHPFSLDQYAVRIPYPNQKYGKLW